MVTPIYEGRFNVYACLNKDNRPINPPNGSLVQVIDTGKWEQYDAVNDRWHQAALPSPSDGSGELGENFEWTTVSGSMPLSFEYATEEGLKFLIRHGLCVKSSGDLLCNNGKITVVDDELPFGYKRLTGIAMANARYIISDFYLTGADTLRFSGKGAASGWIGCYNASEENDNYSFYASTNAAGKYARYNGQTGGSSISNANTWYNIVMSPSGIEGIRNPSEWTPSEFTCSVQLTVGSHSPTGAASSNVSFRGNIEVDGRLKLIPCERASDGVIGWYDGTTFYTPTIESGGSVTSLGYDASHYHVGVYGTRETITLSSNGGEDQTAYVEDLLSVYGYEDTQDVISGSVRREVGIYIFTGEEDITYASDVFSFEIPGCAAVSSEFVVMCNAYEGVSCSCPVSSMADLQMKINGGGSTLVWKNSYYQSAEGMKGRFTNLYAAGTPVIVLYPLADPTVEYVDAQPIKTNVGQNNLSVSACIMPLPAVIEYLIDWDMSPFVDRGVVGAMVIE